jgi:hypothetical protein
MPTPNNGEDCENRDGKKCHCFCFPDMECQAFHNLIAETPYFLNRGICPMYWEKDTPRPVVKEKIGEEIEFGDCRNSCNSGNRWVGCKIFPALGCAGFTMSIFFSIYRFGTNQECPFYEYTPRPVYHYPCVSCGKRYTCPLPDYGYTETCDSEYVQCMEQPEQEQVKPKKIAEQPLPKKPNIDW